MRRERILKKLKEKYPEAKIRITDRTDEHIGHREMMDMLSPEETHLDIFINTKEFNNIPTVNAIREVNKLINDEFDNGLHAVSITCLGIEDTTDPHTNR
ncbi:hypothetical protein NEOKW01_0324 [Nematocida sp. AWRm80]|nr:hypothetical protein NEOKW01_0324 [Nematocida sp. AWRm80]